MTSLIHLQSMLRIQLYELRKEIFKHSTEWKQQKFCLCYGNNQDEYFECAHLLSDRKIKFEKKINKIYSRFGILGRISIPK